MRISGNRSVLRNFWDSALVTVSRMTPRPRTLASSLAKNRRLFAGKASTYGLISTTNKANQGHVMVVPGTKPNVEGTPVLTWIDYGRDDRQPHGWALSIQGLGVNRLGFAPWNDKEAISNLATSLKDREGLYALAALIVPVRLALLNSRMFALSSGGAALIPDDSLHRVRRVLAAAGLASRIDRIDRNAALFSLIALDPFANKPNPVAVRIAAPTYDLYSGLTYGEYEETVAGPWVEEALSALAGDGWRSVKVADDDGYQMGDFEVWVTLMDGALWDAVRGAAGGGAAQARGLNERI